MSKIFIVGVGSILMGDDGIGMRVIDELEKETLPDEVELHGADISGLDMLKYVEGYERVIIIDAANMSLAPGEIRVFTPEEIEPASFNDKFSTHGMGLLETLTLAGTLGMKCKFVIVGVQPKNVDYNLELSTVIENKIPEIIKTVKDIIAQ
jgi:hydrogenase maturation protease